ncbi:hypothetical protein MKW92_010450 [Papaver armeniacum]|nr:hypothetical protein MKW92_010450 [Papaver armeniacum]
MGLIVLEGLMEEKNKQLAAYGRETMQRLFGANESTNHLTFCFFSSGYFRSRLEDQGTLRKLVTEIQRVEEEDKSYMDGKSEDQT